MQTWNHACKAKQEYRDCAKMAKKSIKSCVFCSILIMIIVPESTWVTRWFCSQCPGLSDVCRRAAILSAAINVRSKHLIYYLVMITITSLCVAGFRYQTKMALNLATVAFARALAYNHSNNFTIISWAKHVYFCICQCPVPRKLCLWNNRYYFYDFSH